MIKAGRIKQMMCLPFSNLWRDSNGHRLRVEESFRMSGNTFGKLFTITTFGESHGPALGRGRGRLSTGVGVGRGRFAT
jgi:hypothetical protein